MWHGIFGHDAIVDQFRRTLMADRLASTYLFVGPEGIGKRQFALQLAQALLCTESPDATLELCGRCQSCRLFVTGNHPDLHVVELPKDKSKLPIELFVGDREHRHQEGLCHRIALKPFLSGRKIAVIDDADYFNQESANCLLKTLEEPPPQSLLILIGTSPSRQLPTIRSRAQLVRFAPLETDVVACILRERGLLADPAQAARAAELSAGSVSRAVALADPELWRFREQLFAQLADPSPVRLARAVQSFVDDAGKEMAQKRDRLRIVIDFAISFYRGRLCENGTPSELERTTGVLDACLSALEQVDRNANLAMVIQHWSDELANPSSSITSASLV